EPAKAERAPGLGVGQLGQIDLAPADFGIEQDCPAPRLIQLEVDRIGVASRLADEGHGVRGSVGDPVDGGVERADGGDDCPATGDTNRAVPCDPPASTTDARAAPAHAEAL